MVRGVGNTGRGVRRGTGRGVGLDVGRGVGSGAEHDAGSVRRPRGQRGGWLWAEGVSG